jgi:S-adenosylmethionine synthetase
MSASYTTLRHSGLRRWSHKSTASDGIEGAECCLVSRIGRPVDDPAAVLLRLAPETGYGLDDCRRDAELAARDGIAQIPGLWKELVHGDIPVF